jgi:hypothetical protein
MTAVMRRLWRHLSGRSGSEALARLDDVGSEPSAPLEERDEREDRDKLASDAEAEEDGRGRVIVGVASNEQKVLCTKWTHATIRTSSVRWV